MEPSPQLVLLTTQKINNYLKSQNQDKSYISEKWVYLSLKEHIYNSTQVGLIMNDNEISDRVTTIAVRRLRANIATSTRFKNEWKDLMSRPGDTRDNNFHLTEIAQIPQRGEKVDKKKQQIILPDRHISYS